MCKFLIYITVEILKKIFNWCLGNFSCCFDKSLHTYLVQQQFCHSDVVLCHLLATKSGQRKIAKAMAVMVALDYSCELGSSSDLSYEVPAGGSQPAESCSDEPYWNFAVRSRPRSCQCQYQEPLAGSWIFEPSPGMTRCHLTDEGGSSHPRFLY